MSLTHADLRKALAYDPETGLFTWRVSRGSVKPGVHAARSACRYTAVRMDGKRYYAHRLAFLWMTGCWPEGDVDHIDGDGTNNRWSNLREATQSQNNGNQRLRSDSVTGFKGVGYVRKDRAYRARLRVGGKQLALGYFKTPEAAYAAYCVAAKAHFGEFAKMPSPEPREGL